MVTEEQLRTIREITEILGVYFTGSTEEEAEEFINNYEPLVNDMFDTVVF